MNNIKIIKELTGEDPVDMFGGDAENIVDELSTLYCCDKCISRNGLKNPDGSVASTAKCSTCPEHDRQDPNKKLVDTRMNAILENQRLSNNSPIFFPHICTENPCPEQDKEIADKLSEEEEKRRGIWSGVATQMTPEEIKQYRKRCHASECKKRAWLEDWKGSRYCVKHWRYYMWWGGGNRWYEIKTTKIIL